MIIVTRGPIRPWRERDSHMKTIRLIDFEGIETIHQLEDFDQIETIEIQVISGDEIAVISYKDGLTKRLDSSDTRVIDIYDLDYQIPLDTLDYFNSLEETDSYERARRAFNYLAQRA